MKTTTTLCLGALVTLLLAGPAQVARADVIVEPHPDVRKSIPKLVVVVRPHRAQILLTGKRVKITARGRLARMRLAPGDYKVTVSFTGHVTQTRRIQIKRKGKVSIKLILKKQKKGKKAPKPASR